MDENTPTQFSRVLLLAGLGVGYWWFVRPRLKTWGATPEEAQCTLPGDTYLLHPDVTITQAIDIPTPASTVWTWMAHIGDSTFWQAATSPDSISSYLHQDVPPVDATYGSGFKVLQHTPETLFTFGSFNTPNLFGSTLDLTVSYLLKELPDGTTRVLSRVHWSTYGLGGLAYNILAEPNRALLLAIQLRTLRRLCILSQPQIRSGEKTNGKWREPIM